MPIPGMNLASQWLARMFSLFKQNQYEFKSLEVKCSCLLVAGGKDGCDDVGRANSSRKVMNSVNEFDEYTEIFLHTIQIR
jgi:hypothetical protein